MKQMELEVGRLTTIIDMKGESHARMSTSNEQLLNDI
jgi:hypothetical protein